MDVIIRIDRGDYLQERGGHDWGRANACEATYYDTVSEAKAAADRLKVAGIVRAYEYYDAGTGETTPAEPGAFAARLRQLRTEAGLSVEALAAKAGMNRTHLHKFEAGTKKPTLETAQRLAVALGVSLSVFDAEK